MMYILAIVALLVILYVFVQPQAMAPWEIEEMNENERINYDR